jgi:hypothetical protein
MLTSDFRTPNRLIFLQDLSPSRSIIDVEMRFYVSINTTNNAHRRRSNGVKTRSLGTVKKMI